MALAQRLVEAPVPKAAAAEPAMPVLETSFDKSSQLSPSHPDSTTWLPTHAKNSL